MKLLRIVPAFLLLTACSAETAEGEDTDPVGQVVSADRIGPGGPGTLRAALRGLFRKDKVKRVGTGACKFQDDADGPADAFVIANGQDIAVVFTKLGEPTRRGRRNNRMVSRCNFTIPIEVPDGSYISAWQQSLQYGIVKPAGVAAGLGLDSALQATFGGRLVLPDVDVKFPRREALDIPLAVASNAPLTFDGPEATHKQWKKRWCTARRAPDLTYAGSAFTWTERDADNTPVIIAIDGLDMRFDLGSVVSACPATP